MGQVERYTERPQISVAEQSLHSYWRRLNVYQKHSQANHSHIRVAYVHHQGPLRRLFYSCVYTPVVDEAETSVRVVVDNVGAVSPKSDKHFLISKKQESTSSVSSQDQGVLIIPALSALFVLYAI